MTIPRLRSVLTLAISSLSIHLGAAPARAQHWVQENGFGFTNFSTAELSWERFRDTFIGVPPTHDPWSSAFDVLFYDHLYKNELSKDGNCYGIALLACFLHKEQGFQGVCAPAPQYSETMVADPAAHLVGVINQLHAHQVNLPTLRHLLDLIAIAKHRDGNYAFQQVSYWWNQNDPALVSVTESLNPADGGHTMVAYDARVVGGQKRIFVYDPNRPWYSDEPYYTGGLNVIKITGGGNWEFDMGGTTGTWSGGPASGGNIIVTPLSVTGPISRLPTTLGFETLVDLQSIFIFAGGGSLEQVRDAGGKRLFEPGTMEIDADPATGLLKIVPVFLSDGQDKEGRELGQHWFFTDDPGPGLELSVTSEGDGYALELMGRTRSIAVRAAGASGTETLRLERGAGGEVALVLESPTGASTYDVQLRSTERGLETTRTLRVSDLRLPAKGAARIAWRPGTGSVDLSAAQATTACRVQLTLSGVDGDVTVASPPVSLRPDRVLSVRPENWRELSPASLRITERAARRDGR